ncbi:MAG: alpha-glucan family phosphorylase [Candidatus Eisenbacteria bacterium]|nr:alpha-glucan family phosphorylase [Candidatus Eisenbacteria bacterium]
MRDCRIAYFSMELALKTNIPTYSGGLGVLAGDTIRSAADLGVPLLAVTLLHRKGYLYQRLDAEGNQTEEPVEWVVEDFLTETPARVSVTIGGRQVAVRAWRYDVKGVTGSTVPVFLLDTDLPENDEQDRELTNRLYGGDTRYRFSQEIVLGIGGVRMLRALGCENVQRFHMNEGHAALLTLELLDEEARRAGRERLVREDIDKVREMCVFTTHTPVPAGHDQFPLDMVAELLGPHDIFRELKGEFSLDVMHQVLKVKDHGFDTGKIPAEGEALNMTYLALNLSGYVNGVAKRHGELSRLMFAGYHVEAITNGVHAATWVSEPFGKLYDESIPGWREDNFSLRSALAIPNDRLWAAHAEAKETLLQRVNRETNVGMDVAHLTLGFARRATGYKRADLLFSDMDRLARIVAERGPIQIVYAGKAHPKDETGKELIRRIFRAMEALKGRIKIAYLANYDMALGLLMTSGVDIWLNTPQPPNEASGTSGMKAALNGVPSLSVLDGWWIEGCIEGITGWSIGRDGVTGNIQDSTRDADDLYAKLEKTVLPWFYDDRNRFINVMRHTVALNGSFFNTQRMVQQYVVNAYL